MKKIIGAILVLCLMTGASMAGTQAGQVEVGGSVMIMMPKEGDNMYMVMGSGGYFVTAQLELKAVGLIVSTDGEAQGLVGGGADLFLSAAGDTLPYVGANAMSAVGDGGYGDGLIVDMHAGIKQFVGENVSVNYSLSYNATTDDFGNGYMIGMIGLSIYM